MAGLAAVPVVVAAAAVAVGGTGAVAPDGEGGVVTVCLTCSFMAVVRMIISLSGQATMPVPRAGYSRECATDARFGTRSWLSIICTGSGQGKRRVRLSD